MSSFTSAPSLPPLGFLSFGQDRLDRGCARRAAPDLLQDIRELPTTRFLPFIGGTAPLRNGQLALLETVATHQQQPANEDNTEFASDATAAVTEVYLGRILNEGSLPAGTDVVLRISAQNEPPESGKVEAETGLGADIRWAGLRDVAAELDVVDAALFVEGAAIANWHRTHSHCPRCGASTTVEQSGWVRRCPNDGSQHFPRTDPAIIVAVVDEADRLLLGSGTNWAASRFSTLAGFVEPGESLEAAVIREIEEESGIVVHSPRYLGSQPWPFPNSLMLGFTATATNTVTAADEVEIREVRWFTRAQLAEELIAGSLQVAGGVSIARALIEHWYGGKLPAPAGAAARV